MIVTTDKEGVADIHQDATDDRILRWVSSKVTNEAVVQSTSSPTEPFSLEVEEGLMKNLFIKPVLEKESTVRFKATQSWVGHIIRVDEDAIEVRFHDLNSGGTDEIALLDWDDINPDDKSLVRLGAVVYCSVGRMIRNGQVLNAQITRLRRLASWNLNDIDSLSDEAAARMRSLGLK
jgi:hypothetical protein